METGTQNSQGLTVYESRWGFHPCTREDCLILKRLHWQAWCMLREILKHDCWIRKTVHRVGPEPVCPELQRKMALSDRGFKRCYRRLLADYSSARRPVDHPDKVTPILPVEAWVKAFFFEM